MKKHTRMFVQEYNKRIDKIINLQEDFAAINDQIASGDINYAYPYQLKEFIIRYAQLVKIVLEDTKCRSSTTSCSTDKTTQPTMDTQ